MAWTLVPDNVLPVTRYHLGGKFELIDDKKFKAESFPVGEEFCELQAPAGKKWTVNVSISITETDI